MLLDESKRQKQKDSLPAALYVSDGKVSKKNKSWKKNNGKFYKVYKKANHESSNYFVLHPKKAPKA